MNDELHRALFRWSAENEMPKRIWASTGLEYEWGGEKIGERNLRFQFCRGTVTARIFNEQMGCGDKDIRSITSVSNLISLLEWVSHKV